MKTQATTLLIAVMLTACGGGGSDSGGGSPEPEEKSLFSIWTNTEDEDDVIDFEEGSLGEEMPFTFTYPDGAVCTCTLELSGSQTSGNFILNSCEFDRFSTQYDDPGCNDLNGTGTYSVDNDILTICDDELECDTFE